MGSLIKFFTIILLWTPDDSDNQFFLQKSTEGENEALLAVTFIRNEGNVTTKCELITDNDKIEEELASLNRMLVDIVSEKEIKRLLEECSEIVLPGDSSENEVYSSNESTEYVKRALRERRQASEGTTEAISTRANEAESTSGIGLTFPGTKWCGPGDTAENYDDLGEHQETDKCCRTHDHCDDILAPGESKGNLTNTRPYTALNCRCDDEFYNCLERDNSVTSNTIGNIYFNILKSDCYAVDYPQKCKEYYTVLKLKCKEWEDDTKGQKVLQWFPAKKYKNTLIPKLNNITIPSSWF